MMALQKQPTLMQFSELLEGIYFIQQSAVIQVSGLCLDSRKIQSGDLFFALQGQQGHGKQYIAEVLAQGAVVVLVESNVAGQSAIKGVPVFMVPGLRYLVGRIAERFYGEPSRQQHVVGVTGTNGKTSVTHFIAQALHGDAPCGVVGTLGNGIFGQLSTSGFTTPDAVSLHATLDGLQQNGVNNVVMEVSSHGLEQGRVAGVEFDVAVFTNLSHDHLDYHGDMEKYGQAKRRLFDSKSLKYAVINIDDDYGRELLVSLPATVGTVSYGLKQSVDGVVPSLLGSNLQLDRNGLRMRIESDWGSEDLQIALIGAFNASNILAALGAILAAGISFKEAVARLAKVSPVPGRMQFYGGSGQGDVADAPLVVVDFAHTPDALEQVLLALREHTTGQLWCLFGCGGDRDAAKRPLMAALAERLADHVIVSDDNPRSESSELIIADILQGFERVDEVSVIAARDKAIESVVLAAGNNDVVLIAGKGHEKTQIVTEQKRPFNDGDEVMRSLALRKISVQP
jgi:UDP-N-acetylmuramoyl-L-alanyl-D-glutamate--2,6-diaminopimelate ligase